MWVLTGDEAGTTPIPSPSPPPEAGLWVSEGRYFPRACIPPIKALIKIHIVIFIEKYNLAINNILSSTRALHGTNGMQ